MKQQHARRDYPPPLPLYLISARNLRASIDGPALRVSAPGEPVRRYPLSRISRVVAGMMVDWQGRAIAGLLRNGIPIVLLESDGHVSGYLQTARRRQSDLAQMLHEFAGRPDWEIRYRNWQRAMRMQLLDSWNRRRGRRGAGGEKRIPEQLVHETVYHGQSIELPHARAVNAVVSGVVAKMLEQQQLSVSYPAFGGGSIQLASDLSGLLTYLVTLELFACGYTIRGDDGPLLDLLHRYCGKIEGKGSWLLALLQKHLSEVLQEWQ